MQNFTEVLIPMDPTVIIPFNKPYITGKELEYLQQALKSLHHCGNGEFCRKCIDLMRQKYGVAHVFLTPSCTAAMEMGAILAGLKPGDEVILPSYTFSSTVNAIALCGAHPVFCEITPDTMNMDVSKIESLVTEKTRMIAPIDYAGIPCEIDAIMNIAQRHGLFVMLDAAQSLHSFFKGSPTGVFADFTAFSFHETKNCSCGEGGALLIKDKELARRAELVQEKGTDRSLVLKGVKNKYGWVDVGSSFLLSDIQAAILLAQLENVEAIVAKRSKITEAYRKLFSPYERHGLLSVPKPPSHVEINHHAFFVIFDTSENQALFLSRLKARNIHAYIGYLPLHSSPMGKRFGYKPEDLPLTEDLANRIVRLPFYTHLAEEGLEDCLSGMADVLQELYPL